MTEEEAQSKWCPFAIQAHGFINHRTDTGGYAASNIGGGINRSPQDAPVTKCIASECMAWRWATEPNPEWKPDHSMMWPPSDTRFGEQPYIADKKNGFCGLAGKP